MIIIVFVLLVGVLILSTYMRRKDESRRAEAHERKKEKFERLMEILKKQNSDKNAEVSDTTEADKDSESWQKNIT